MKEKPEYHAHEDFVNRSLKLKEIRDLGVEPYPHKFTPSHHTQALHTRFEKANIGHSEEAEVAKTPFATLSGRLVLFRAMGKNAFGHIQDNTGRLQVMFNRDHTLVEGFHGTEELKPLKFIEKKFDLGDILGVEGHLFHTNKGELTLYVKKVTLLTKTLLPLPDKHSGLADIELRYRKRWLDLIVHPDIRERFKVRSQILSVVREHFHELDFLEVETPILQNVYGGAEARPFITRLNALDQEMFMRISLEIPLKKLIVGGMDKVFEIGKVFRNEGIDRNHNPEFTLLEAYASYWDYHDMMHTMEMLFEKLAIKLFGTSKVPYLNPDTGECLEIDMKAPWRRLTMKEAIKTFGGHDVDIIDDLAITTLLIESGEFDPKEVTKMSRGLLIQNLFEITCEKKLIQPHHIIDHPIETTPLCKPHRSEKERKEGLVERFESFILGQEIANSYTELNDPEIQRELLEKQAERRDGGDEEAPPLDEEFLEAICQGMPPCGGIGIGIDRLVMLFTNSHSIRDVLYFPWMKPHKPHEKEGSKPTA